MKERDRQVQVKDQALANPNGKTHNTGRLGAPRGGGNLSRVQEEGEREKKEKRKIGKGLGKLFLGGLDRTGP